MPYSWLAQLAALPNNPELIQQFITNQPQAIQQAYEKNDQSLILNAASNLAMPDRNTVYACE